MKRSTIVGEVLLFAFFVVLVKIPETTTTTAARPLYAKDGFLVGEETPFWIATLKGRKVVYTKVNQPIVRNSVNDWNSLKENSSFPIATWDDRIDSADTAKDIDVPRNAREVTYTSPKKVGKRSTDENEVVYPSVLVVINYNSIHPSHTRKIWSYNEAVLYTLAFWGTVDSSLRNIQNPRVSVRIAGIVLVKSRNVLPYSNWYSGERSYGGALCPMMDYWRSLAAENPDFAIGSYDIVAHMTNNYPRIANDECSNVKLESKTILDVGMQGPPCKLPDKIGGFIVYDDFKFAGLHRAIAQMSKILGGDDKAPLDMGWPRRAWRKATLDPISNALKNASCMSEPKELFPPGRPVAPILAGEIWPSEKQCELYGYGANANTCWNSTDDEKRSTCRYLCCSKEGASDDACEVAGLTLDGTVCDAEKTKICLDGACVDKP